MSTELVQTSTTQLSSHARQSTSALGARESSLAVMAGARVSRAVERGVGVLATRQSCYRRESDMPEFDRLELAISCKHAMPIPSIPRPQRQHSTASSRSLKARRGLGIQSQARVSWTGSLAGFESEVLRIGLARWQRGACGAARCVVAPVLSPVSPRSMLISMQELLSKLPWAQSVLVLTLCADLLGTHHAPSCASSKYCGKEAVWTNRLMGRSARSVELARPAMIPKGARLRAWWVEGEGAALARTMESPPFEVSRPL